MGNYAEYFEKNRYKPKYEIGDRVRGVWGWQKELGLEE